LSISYTIQPSHPEAHIFSVTLTVTNPNPAGQRFELPNWIPGSYMIRDFSKNLLAIKASSDGQVVP